MTVGVTVILLLLTSWLVYFLLVTEIAYSASNRYLREITSKRCLSGGADAENSGLAAAASEPVETKDGIKEEEENLIPVDELDALLAAAEEENTR